MKKLLSAERPRTPYFDTDCKISMMDFLYGRFVHLKQYASNFSQHRAQLPTQS